MVTLLGMGHVHRTQQLAVGSRAYAAKESSLVDG